MRTIKIQIGKKYWDLETCRKSCARFFWVEPARAVGQPHYEFSRISSPKSRVNRNALSKSKWKYFRRINLWKHISVQKWSQRDTNYSNFRSIFKMGNVVWFFFQNKLFENLIKKSAWKNVQSNDHSTLHNSQRRKELQFSQTQLSGRSWRNTRYYIFWTSRTFVKPLRTHLPSIFSLKFCHHRTQKNH